MRGKASKEDLTGVLGRSVELALDAYRRAAGEAQGTGATRFKWVPQARACRQFLM